MAKNLKYPVGTKVLSNPRHDCWERKIPAGVIIAVFPRYRIVRWDKAGDWYSAKVEALPLGKIIPDTPRIRELAAKYATIYEELGNINEDAHKRIKANHRAFQRELTRVLKQVD